MTQVQTPQTDEVEVVTSDQFSKWEQVTRDFIRRNKMDRASFQAFMGLPHLAGDMDRIARKVKRTKPTAPPVVTITLTDSQQAAKAIMGTNFFGPEEATKHFSAKWTDDQLAALATVPYSAEILEACQDTHVLVAGYPMTLVQIRAKVKRGLFYSNDGAWYNGEAFTTKTQVKVRWYLIRKTPVDNSTNKSWAEQQALLKDETTPTACVMAYTIIGHFLNTGERLFKNIYVRVSDIDSYGFRVYLGYFDANGLYVSWYSGGDRYSFLGLSASRN